MKIKQVELFNFRNYTTQKVEFGDGLNIIEGKNAQGKTNLVEAIYFCAVGKSFRATREKEVISWGKDIAKIKVTIEKEIGNKVIQNGKYAVVTMAGGQGTRLRTQRTKGKLCFKYNKWSKISI